MLKKRYLKSKAVCKVTFQLPKDAVRSAKKVNVVGEFNKWDTQSTPMKKRKDGSFSVVLGLRRDSNYQFRYLIDGRQWENDWEADRYVVSPYGDSDNSVVVV
ncbi:MAG: isoamylase early set domain-containing protein [Pseudomonadota bacterium]